MMVLLLPHFDKNTVLRKYSFIHWLVIDSPESLCAFPPSFLRYHSTWKLTPLNQVENTHHLRGRISEQLVLSLTGLNMTKHENILLFRCTQTTESKAVKHETSRRPVILSPYGGECSLTWVFEQKFFKFHETKSSGKILSLSLSLSLSLH